MSVKVFGASGQQEERTLSELLSMSLLTLPPRSPSPLLFTAGPSSRSEDINERPLWIDLECNGSDDAALQTVGRAFCLHPLTVEDILHPDSREKAEAFDFSNGQGYFFLVIRESGWIPETNWPVETNLCIVATADLVLTVHLRPVSSTQVAAARLSSEWESRRIRRQPPPPPAFVVMALVDAVVDGHMFMVDQIRAESDAIAQLVLVFGPAEQDDVLSRIAHARRRLADLEGLVAPKRAIAKMLLKDGANILAGGATVRVFFRDIIDHCVRMKEKLALADANLDAVSETYLAKISIAMAQASNNVNDVMRRFTAVATIFLPLSLVTSLFGMNVHVPGGGTHSILPFIHLCVVLAAFSIIVLVFFRVRRWI